MTRVFIIILIAFSSSRLPSKEGESETMLYIYELNHGFFGAYAFVRKHNGEHIVRCYFNRVVRSNAVVPAYVDVGVDDTDLIDHFLTAIGDEDGAHRRYHAARFYYSPSTFGHINSAALQDALKAIDDEFHNRVFGDSNAVKQAQRFMSLVDFLHAIRDSDLDDESMAKALDIMDNHMNEIRTTVSEALSQIEGLALSISSDAAMPADVIEFRAAVSMLLSGVNEILNLNLPPDTPSDTTTPSQPPEPTQ